MNLRKHAFGLDSCNFESDKLLVVVWSRLTATNTLPAQFYAIEAGDDGGPNREVLAELFEELSKCGETVEHWQVFTRIDYNMIGEENNRYAKLVM